MLERVIYDHYRLFSDKIMKVGRYDAIQSNGRTYIISPIAPMNGTETVELIKLIQQVYKQGDKSVAIIERTTEGKFHFAGEQGNFALLRLPEERQDISNISYGKELALFHKRTSGYSFQNSSRNYFLSWKVFWQKRMEQMEAWYESLKSSSEIGEVDQLFIETFPYILGLTENALQYVGEVERSEVNIPYPTVCHNRFSSALWDCGGYFVKNPTTWIIDQPTRDIAEYIRNDMFEKNGVKEKVLQFINNYEKQMPLTKEAWKFLYARLLFPVTYYENIEGYYSARTNDNKKRYENIIRKSITQMESYEENLSVFYKTVGLPTEQLKIPIIDWLQHK